MDQPISSNATLLKFSLSLVLFLSSAVSVMAAGAAEFYVSTTGKDSNSGASDAPFASLTQARNAIRTLKARGALTEPVRVIVAGGTYYVTEPLVLTPEDSGTAMAPVSYEAAPGERPIISGGRMIGGWQDAGDGVWTAQVPKVAGGEWSFEQLWVNGRRAMRARTPNDFWFYLQAVNEVAAAPGRGKVAVRTARLRSEDFASLADLTSEELQQVILVVYHKWDVTRRRLDAIDSKTSQLVTSGDKMKPWNPWARNSAAVLENFRAALDAPGEWFLAAGGRLHYKPLPGEELSDIEVVAPTAEKLLIFAGDPAAGKFVEHIVFKGLSFRHGQWLMPSAGFEPTQAAASVEAAVMVDGARHVTIEDCEVTHVGGYGVWFRKGCRKCALCRCLVEDLGAGGVRIGETRIAPEGPERTGQIVVDNCIIRRGGRILPPAVGIWIGQSGDNTVTHNEIADFLYTGISTGWTWGYGEGLAKRNTIAFNRVHHIGQGVLSDMGGIYTLGPSEGTIVRNNVFHDVYASTYGGWGLYTDEGSTGILFENNLVYGTKTGSFHQHYGKQNVVRNNILAFSELHQLQATRVEDHLSFTFENNIILWDRGELLSGPWEKMNFAGGKNLFWRMDGQPVRFAGHTLEEWQAQGHEPGSRIADPLFADPTAENFELAADSPALDLGFKPFDPDKAGVYGDATWVQKAREATFPPLRVAPPPP